MRKIRMLFIGLALPTSTIAASDITVAVKSCIQVARDAGYPTFDAFYNPASKSVENNVTNVLNQGALFPFNKCMAAEGFPLAYSKK